MMSRDKLGLRSTRFIFIQLTERNFKFCNSIRTYGNLVLRTLFSVIIFKYQPTTIIYFIGWFSIEI
jgi:hypothetical protein